MTTHHGLFDSSEDPHASPGRGPCWVEVLGRVRDIPAESWAALAPADDPMWSQQVFEAMESASIGPDVYAYVTVRDAAGIVAVLPLSGMRTLRIDNVVGSHDRKLLSPVRKVAPRLLQASMLFCGHFLGQGHVLAREPLTYQVSRLVLRAVLDYAAAQRLGTVVLKDFTPEELAALQPALEETGFFTVPGLPDTELTLGQDGFEGYLADMSAKARRNVRSKLRKFSAHDDLRIEILTDFHHLIPEMLGLYQQVMDRAEQTLDVIDERFLSALREADGFSERLVACFEGDRLVAYLHCFFRGRGSIGARIGLDYRLAYEARLYHVVHYAAIEHAIAEGYQHIRFAQTAYEPKREFGCRLVEQSYAMTHVKTVPRAVLRRLLPPALKTAREAALKPRS
jgi:predicted N-acyltransferase